MFPTMNRQSLFSQDLTRVMRDFDQMIHSINTMNSLEDMLYEPLAMQQRLWNDPSYFLPAGTDASALMPKHTCEIVQDEKQTQIKLNLPEIDPNDINLYVDDDNMRLKISGQSKHEDHGVAVHSSFERSFSLTHDIDLSHISAQIDDGVLVITAPKYEHPKETVRRIDIVDTGSKEHDSTGEEKTNTNEGEVPLLSKEGSKATVDGNVIDLDVQQ